MKKAVLLVLLFFIVTAAAQTASAQSASKILDRYRKASGGSAARRVKSTLISGSVMGGQAGASDAGRFLYQAALPENIRTDIEAGGVKVSECYNGKSAWRLDGRGLRTLLAEHSKRKRLEALLANNRLGDLDRNRITAQLAGKATVDGREANVIEFIKDVARVKLFFDSATGLVIKQERESIDGPEEIFYADYRAVDGVMEPFSIRVKTGAAEWRVTVDRVEHNRLPGETAFRYPQEEGGRPLPELEALMKSIVANQEKVEEARERYTFRQVETERQVDKSGQTRDVKSSAYEVTPVAGTFVRRLVSVNGKELPAAEREKEDRRVQKLVEELVRRREKQLQKKEEARARGEEDEEKDDLTILDFLRISQVTSVRRETFRGHEVIAFDFEPRKGFKPKNRNESLVSKLAGTMWVDEGARQIARLEARLTNSFKVGGGLLASISPSSAIVIEQEKVGGEVWLPSYAELNFSARLFLFSKLNRNLVRRNSDYKRYKIDSQYEMDKPAAGKKPDGHR